MKSILKFLMAFALLIIANNSYAYDFEVDGIYYNVVSLENLTCEVSRADAKNTQYSGMINIPSEVIYKDRKLDVIGIGEYAFYECNDLTEVILPESISSIGNYAFRYCYNLERLNLPSSISFIGNGAFEYCRKLSSAKIPLSLTKLPSYLFRNCYSLKEIVIPANIKSIGGDVFANSGIERCIIEDSNEPIFLEGAFIQNIDFIHSGSFSNTPLKYLYLGRNYSKAKPSGNKYLFSPFLALNSLEEIIIGGLVTELPVNTFAKPYRIENGYRVYYEPLDSLTKITFIESTDELKFITDNRETSISDFGNIKDFILERNLNWEENIGTLGGESIFSSQKQTSLERAVLSKECTTVNENMFYSCRFLSSIILGQNIKNINKSSFGKTDLLLDIELLTTIPPTFNGEPGFSNNQYLNAKLYVPINSLANYQSVDIWKNFWNIEEGGNSAVSNTIVDNSHLPVLYYNLNGLPIMEEPESGIYIRKQGTKVTKVMK